MTGFTIYETLRIFTPGALAVFVLDVSLRLSTAHSVFGVGGSGPTDIADAIETVATFALLALVFGLFLYLVDLPERLRIFRGDPGWAILPSTAMRSLIEDTSPFAAQRYKDYALNLFFLFSDKYVPDDLHKRIYLFGAVYKIFVDLRVLTVTALVASVPAAIVAARIQGTDKVTPGFSTVGAIGVAVIVAYVVVMGAIAARTRLVRHLESNPSDDPTRPPTLGMACVLVLAVLASAAIVIAARLRTPAAWISLLPAAAALTWWFWMEVGPPRTNSHRWRDNGLAALGCERSDQPQFSPFQRTLIDLAIFVPFLVGASIADAHLGRPPTAVLAWAVFVVPATTIMTIRKHESRLLGAYRHQLAWLMLNEVKIKEVLEGRAGFGDLEKAPQTNETELTPTAPPPADESRSTNDE